MTKRKDKAPNPESTEGSMTEPEIIEVEEEDVDC